MRPTTLDAFVGQTHLLAKDKPLRVAIEHGKATLDDLSGGRPEQVKQRLARIISQIHLMRNSFLFLQFFLELKKYAKQ